MEEMWKDVIGYENIYQVSTLGNIRRISLGRNNHSPGSLKVQIYNKGKNKYALVRLYKNGIGKTLPLHRIVMETFSELPSFCPTCKVKYEINHIDENGINNKLNNLKYCTRQENINHSKNKQQKRCVRKLTEKSVLSIIQKRRNGTSGIQLSKEFNVSPQTICDITKGRLWNHVNRL
jgi:hypothetical protein